MKKSLLLAAVMGVALLSTSCDIFGGKADYFPLSVGNLWSYALTVVMTDTTWADTVTGTMKQEAVKEDELTSGEKVFMMVTTSIINTDGPYYDTSYIRKDGDKVMEYSDKDDSTPDLLLDGPLAVDKTWTMDEGVSAKVIGKDNVTVAAGTYKNCWKVECTSVTDADTSCYYMWFADGTGHIKYLAEEEESGESAKMTYELTSATIK